MSEFSFEISGQWFGGETWSSTAGAPSGMVMPLTECCRASGKGSDSATGVVCRACYVEVDTYYGNGWLLDEVNMPADVRAALVERGIVPRHTMATHERDMPGCADPDCEFHYPAANAADLIIDSEIDGPALVEALVPLLTDAGRTALAESLDLCPVHLCDAQICADDEQPCQTTETETESR